MYTYTFPRIHLDSLWWHWCPPEYGVGQWVAVCHNRDLPLDVVHRMCPYCGMRGTAHMTRQFDWPAWQDPELSRDLWMRIPPDLLA